MGSGLLSDSWPDGTDTAPRFVELSGRDVLSWAGAWHSDRDRVRRQLCLYAARVGGAQGSPNAWHKAFLTTIL